MHLLRRAKRVCSAKASAPGARCWAALRPLRARAVRVGGGGARIGRPLRAAAAPSCSGVLVRLAC
eukprot:2307636-Prymnesium_polylepis.1